MDGRRTPVDFGEGARGRGGRSGARVNLRIAAVTADHVGAAERVDHREEVRRGRRPFEMNDVGLEHGEPGIGCEASDRLAETHTPPCRRRHARRARNDRHPPRRVEQKS
jgi:hypothetical protein